MTAPRRSAALALARRVVDDGAKLYNDLDAVDVADVLARALLAGREGRGRREAVADVDREGDVDRYLEARHLARLLSEELERDGWGDIVNVPTLFKMVAEDVEVDDEEDRRDVDGVLAVLERVVERLPPDGVRRSVWEHALAGMITEKKPR